MAKEGLKMLEVYAEDHQSVKELAIKAGLTVRKYIAKIVKELKDASVRDSK